MTNPAIPQTYAQWLHCITVERGISLTRGFVDERLTALHASTGEEARRFAQLYGSGHLQRVRAWFEEARLTLAEKPSHG